MIASRRTSALAGSAVLATLALTGCGALSSSDAQGADGVRVATAFYPLEYVAARVAGEHAEVVNLTQPGGEPHELSLGVRETAEVGDADLVVYELGFQPAIDDTVAQVAEGELLEVTTVVDLMPFQEHEGPLDEHTDEHSDEHTDGPTEAHSDEPTEEHSEGDGHDHGEFDPHFWQDPLRMADLGTAVADRLAEVDPDHADDYRANAEALRGDLEELDGDYEKGLATCKRDVVVVSHDAFGYLAKYGLHLEPIAGLSPDAEPTPADLAELQHVIEEEGVTTVFSERLVSPKLSESLAKDMGIRTDVLDPIEGLTDQTAGEDYLSLMRANLEALQQANSC